MEAAKNRKEERKSGSVLKSTAEQNIFERVLNTGTLPWITHISAFEQAIIYLTQLQLQLLGLHISTLWAMVIFHRQLLRITTNHRQT